MRVCVIAAIAAIISIPRAQATIVWFEAAPITSATWVEAQGPGQTLELVCDAGPIPGSFCEWQVSMKATLGASLFAWDLDLRTAPGNGVSLLNPQVQPPFNAVVSNGTLGSGPSLLYNAGGLTFTAVPPQTLTLMTFKLRRTYPGGGLYSDAVFGGSSTAEMFVWATDQGEYDVVQFGPNPAAPALPGVIGPLPLITLLEVPEPASLSLLALGAAVCLRRRLVNHRP